LRQISQHLAVLRLLDLTVILDALQQRQRVADV
jgi:hypothetical protein